MIIVLITPTVPPQTAAIISLTVGPITTPFNEFKNAYPVPTVTGSTIIFGVVVALLLPCIVRKRFRRGSSDVGMNVDVVRFDTVAAKLNGRMLNGRMGVDAINACGLVGVMVVCCVKSLKSLKEKVKN